MLAGRRGRVANAALSGGRPESQTKHFAPCYRSNGRSGLGRSDHGHCQRVPGGAVSTCATHVFHYRKEACARSHIEA